MMSSWGASRARGFPSAVPSCRTDSGDFKVRSLPNSYCGECVQQSGREKAPNSFFDVKWLQFLLAGFC